jgi:ABC-type branched-subunit amino acid transport system substrate-binding protein
MYGTYAAGQRDYSALVSTLRQCTVDVLFLGGYHTEAALIVQRKKSVQKEIARQAEMRKSLMSASGH